MIKKPRTRILWIAFFLLFASLACQQAGEVLSPAEATERALPPTREVDPSTNGNTSEGEAEDTLFKAGDVVELIGDLPMVMIFREANRSTLMGTALSGSQVTVVDVLVEHDTVWYYITGLDTGDVWVEEESMLLVESNEGGESSSGEGSSEPQVGDTVYLTGPLFVVNLFEEPGGLGFSTVQDRGVAVEVLEILELEGDLWYRLDSDGGEGWLPSENITTEPPE
jgi:hypothetical protein